MSDPSAPPASPDDLPRGFLPSWERAAASPFVAWWRRAVEEALADPATEAALPREPTRRALGREAEALAGLLARLDEGRRSRLRRELEGAAPADAALAGCLVTLLASHRPFLIAEEILKRRSRRVEGQFLEEALRALSPRRHFPAQLGEVAGRRLAAAWPEAFAETGTVLELSALRELAERAPGGSLDPEQSRAVAGWRDLIEAPRAFDYGCGLGALASVLAEQFETSGGDIYSAMPTGRLSRAIARLRSTRRLDEAPEAEHDGPVDLDLLPDASSPPPEGRFAVVTCNGVLEHVTDEAAFDAVVSKLVRLLRPGGVLLLNASPTRLGFDGHHALHPAWGLLLHRFPSLQSRPRFRDRWRTGYTHRVSRRRLLRALGSDVLPTRSIWPKESTVRARFGAATPLVLPLLRAVGRSELAPIHALLVRKPLPTAG